MYEKIMQPLKLKSKF